MTLAMLLSKVGMGYVLARMIQKTVIADVNTVSPKETNVMRVEDKGTEN